MKVFSIVPILFLVVLTAGAQTNAVPAARTMSLQDCIAEAMAHNLDLQIESNNLLTSLFNLSGAYAGYDPTLSASGQHQYNETGAAGFADSSGEQDSYSAGLSGGTPWGMTYNLSANVSDSYRAQTNGVGVVGSGSSGGQVGISLKQPLLNNFWIDGTRLNIRVAKNRLNYSKQGLRGQIINTVTAVANAYYELIYARENLEVGQEALVLAQTQLDQDNQRVQIGTLAQLDVQQDEAQVSQSQANLIAAQYTLSIDENTLKNLLTDNYPKWHGTDIEPAETLTAPLQLFDLQDSWDKGMRQRPDLLQARLNAEQQGIQLKFLNNQLYPTLDLVGSYGYNGSGQKFRDTFNQFDAGDRPFYSMGVQLSMPLSNVGPRNSYKSGKVTLQQYLLQQKQLEQNAMVGIDNAVKQAQSTYQSVQATKQARVYAAAALDAEQKKYAVGKSTTFTVLQLQNNLTAARSQEIRSLANYNEALANLAAQEGSTLEHNGIKLQEK